MFKLSASFNAAWASSLEENSTKPNPLGLPVFRSVKTFFDKIVP